MARILLVEDETDISTYLREALEREGHTCEQAENGREGLELVVKAKQEWDVIITDLLMPKMSGKDLFKEIREQVHLRTPVVIISGVGYMLDALGELRQGAFSILKKPFELQELYDTVERALDIRRVFQERRRLRETVEELERSQDNLLERNRDLFERARLDPLTELPNRIQMQATLRAEHDNAIRYKAPFALAFIDVDKFARFNNQYGHQVGDSVIRRVAQAIAGHCRQGDSLFRWGGDEFVLILSRQDLAGALTAMDRVREEVASKPIEVDLRGKQETITLSAGVAEVGRDKDPTIEEMMHEATSRLKEAKAAGGNCVRPER